jgi:hypothetical protein
MANRCWVVQNAMAGVRNDLYVLPRLDEKCFYGSPLGKLARAHATYPSDLCIDEPSGLWKFLATVHAQMPGEPNFLGMVNTLSKDKDGLRLMTLWEWLWSIKDGNNNRRLGYFGKIEIQLMQGYVVLMRRALDTAGLQVDAIPERCFPQLQVGGAGGEVHTPVKSARTAGADFYNFASQYTQASVIHFLNIPLHIALLIFRKASAVKSKDVYRDSEKSRSIQDLMNNAKNTDEAPLRVDTEYGVSFKNLPYGVKKEAGLNGGLGSVTASFLVAIAIENWLDEQDDKAAMLNAAMGRSV